MAFPEGKSGRLLDWSNTMTPLMPISPAPILTTPTSSDFLPRAEPNVSTRNATTSPSGLAQEPQVSDLQTKANDNTLEDANGMGSQMSPMTTAITLQVFVVVLVAIGGTSLLWFRRKRRRARRIEAQGRDRLARGEENLFKKLGRRARLFRGKKNNQGSGEKDSTSGRPVHKLDNDEQPPVQQIPEPVLVRESLDVPNWLPELPSHQEISLHNSIATTPPPSSRGSVSQTNPTLQRLRQNLAGLEEPIVPPPRALFTRQSTLSSNYAESVMSSAPSSRPSTIVYASPLRPRPVTRNAPR